jgi:hypothetical protein
MRDKKSTRNEDVLEYVLKLLREAGLRIMTQLINKYETGECP